MASSIITPEAYLAWFPTGNELAIVTKSGGSWAAIDETVADGVLVHYFGEPEPIPFDQPEQYPDFPPSLQSFLSDYIIGRLYEDKAGQAADRPETAAVYIRLAGDRMRRWKNMVNRKLPKLTTKIAGPRRIVPFPLNDR